MSARRTAVILGVAGICAAAALVVWQSRSQARAVTLAAGVPARPALTGFPAGFAVRLATCEQRLKAGSGGVAVLAELGQLYHANGFLPEAVQCYGTLTQVEPSNARWPHRLAGIYAGFGRLEDARLLWQRTVTLDSDYLPARIHLGDVLLKLNRNSEAADAYAAVLTREPANPYALVGLARLDLAAGRLPEAQKRLELASNGTGFSIGADLLATVCEQLGDTERAVALRARVKSSGAYFDPPDPWVDEVFEDCFDVYRLTVVAGFADHAGNSALAQHFIERALALGPDNAAARYQSGTFAMQRHDYNRALQDFEECVRLAPESADGWARLINVQLARGDQAAASRALSEGLGHCPASAVLHLERASRLAAAGRGPEAIAEFEETLRLNPNDADALVKIGNVYFQLDRVDEGIAELRRALVVEPDHPMALTTLALYAINIGDEPAAREWMRRIGRQARVPREMAEGLANQYRQRFGREPR